MSRQLALSAVLSVLATATFALSGSPGAELRSTSTTTGAETLVSAPALDRQHIALPPLLD